MNPLAWLVSFVLPACGFAGAAGVPVPQPMDFAHIQRPSTPNTALAGPAGFQPPPDITTRLYQIPSPALYAALDRVAGAQDRVFPLAAYPERGQIFWVARSATFNFPDVISAEIRAESPQTSSLVLYSRSIYGESDLGVNRKRLLVWIDALNDKTAGAEARPAQ
jgi:hypothetical protein